MPRLASFIEHASSVVTHSATAADENAKEPTHRSSEVTATCREEKNGSTMRMGWHAESLLN
jgi:hypothetical protein